MKGQKSLLFLIGLSLSISLFFVHFSQAQKIGEDIDFFLPQIPSVEDLKTIEFISSSQPPKLTAQLKDTIQLPTLPMLELDVEQLQLPTLPMLELEEIELLPSIEPPTPEKSLPSDEVLPLRKGEKSAETKQPDVKTISSRLSQINK